MKTAPPKLKAQMFALVRDKDGRPKIDDPSTLHPSQIAMLTPEERAEFGVELPENYQPE